MRSIDRLSAAEVGNVISNLDMAGNEYKQTMDNLNSYMEENQFEDELKQKLRAYFLHCKSLFRASYHHQTLMKMSPPLRGEVRRACVRGIRVRARVARTCVAHRATWGGSVGAGACLACKEDTIGR